MTIADSRVVGWLCTKDRKKWNSEGTEQTNEIVTTRKIVETVADAEMYLNVFGYTVTPLVEATAIAALQSRLDAVVGLVAERESILERFGSICDFEGHGMIYETTLTELLEQLRNAALGGESPGNEEMA